MWGAKTESWRESSANASGSSSTSTPTWLELLAFIGTISLSGFLIAYLRPVLMPLVVAIFLSYLVRPLVDCITGRRAPFCYRRFHRWRNRSKAKASEEHEALLPATTDEEAQKLSLAEPAAPVLRTPHAVGVMLAMLVALVIIATIVAAVVFSIFSLEESYKQYKDRGHELWMDALDFLTRVLPFNARIDSNEKLPQELYQFIIMPLLTTLVQAIANTLLVVVFLIFVLLLPAPPTGSFRERVDDLMSEYLFIKCNLACLVGLMVYLFLLAVDVPLRFCIGLATVVLFTVPNIGSMIAALLPVPIVLLEDYPMHKAVCIVLFPAFIHIFVGNFIEPFLFSSGRFALTPIVVLLSLGLWMLLWGVPGALLAIPLTCLVRIGFDFVGENWPEVPYVKGSASAFRGTILDGGKAPNKES